LLKIAGLIFEFYNLEIRFYKRQVTFLVVKTVKCKRGITLVLDIGLVTDILKISRSTGSLFESRRI